MNFQTYTTSKGETLYYVGQPDTAMLEALAAGYGDIWHASFDQGFKNAFPEIVYQTVVFFWFVNDFDGLDQCVSWRINPDAFVVRKSVWDTLQGFDATYTNPVMAAFDFGFNALRFQGAIPMYVKGLFPSTTQAAPKISRQDRYDFYRRNFKFSHALYMAFRKGWWNPLEWWAMAKAKSRLQQKIEMPVIPPKPLEPVQGNPTVSYIIPTMMRQDFTLNLLGDLKQQTYLPTQVVVVDATPENARDALLYRPEDYPFEVIFRWQTTKGSCRARNEAIALCTGDFIIFGDDDIRIPPDFVENHIRLLQTYGAGAANGLDIRADHQQQDLTDLAYKLQHYKGQRWLVGCASTFNNANSCVRREHVQTLVGNDINYDGGYGEDSDFGLSLTKIGVDVLFNPFSTNLHLKPPMGGYRFWGSQAKLMGKKRKAQPWELDTPVKSIRPVPSPTIMYQLHKHFTAEQRKEYGVKYFIFYLFKGKPLALPLRLFRLPMRILQYRKSVFYAKKLMALGKRTQ
ncbi:MAG: glycosyltransferase family 2 protein [Flavobacterium sp.]|jgi:glycosyltransferase involved in cell wall biosynthesis|uniref:glycosyltransferase family 2 protein n=1 Tax=Flavobacterium sp. TaxID=239 RepID=UPI0022BD5525|nr:glycosyltransferase family 2 protein [Flavobacterium sp.]MCZ8169839.1 glycosyltransferase family 2 protein [Flavobacterium sp.]